jgi:hypothetical protein
MPRTDETAAGLWPTAVADDTGLRKKKYSQGGTALSLAVQKPEMWPTPTANDFKGSGRNEAMRDRLDYAVEKPDGKRVSGSLNPQWVEWLMGYPVGYTDLNS